jgi:two-component sensor histidine kinase
MEGTKHEGNDRSFGCELISILAHQLNGEVNMMQSAGITFSMHFVPDKELLRKAV